MDRNESSRALDGILEYVPPNLRPLVSLGYQAGDNLIGFDDGYDTTGELLGRSLQEDPLGTGSALASGAYDAARGFYDDPRGTLAAMGDEFVSAFDLLNTPFPENATREQVGEQLEAVSLLSSVVPGAGLVAKGAKVGLDSAFKGQANRFAKANTPTSPSFAPGPNEIFIIPTEAEVIMLQDMGVGILQYPLRNAAGDFMGTRPYASVTMEEYDYLGRDFNLEDVDVNVVPMTDYTGLVDQDVPRSMKVADDLSEAETDATIKHEMSHLLGIESNLPSDEIGGSFRGFGNASPLRRRELLEELGSRILDARSLEDFSQATAAYRSLSRTTPEEIYYNIPGEILARAAEGDLSSVARLTPLQTLNPYINPEPSSFNRVAKALGTGIFSSQGLLKNLPGDMGHILRHRSPNVDTYVDVPADFDKGRIPNLDVHDGPPTLRFASPPDK